MTQTLLQILAFVIWTAFVAYATWFFTKAKHMFPISFEEARILWKIHRKDLQCNGKRWRAVKHKGKTVGFECECGYKHVQQRPIVAGAPSLQIGPQSRGPVKLGTSERVPPHQKEEQDKYVS